MTPRIDRDELRVLVFAPVGRDAALTGSLLQRASLRCHQCASLTDLGQEIATGAGAVLLTEEALDHADFQAFTATLARQPPWSDIPVLLFAGRDDSRTSPRTLRLLETLRNVTLLDRPARVTALISTIRAALRSRERQYELRDVLVELRAARDEAERANRLKDEFLATLSHELRTPLNAILGWVSMLHHRQIGPEQMSKGLGIIERNAQAQAQLVNDVLDVSRMVNGRLMLRRASVHLTDIVVNAIDSVKLTADAKNVSLSSHITNDLTPVLGDAERLQQVFWNLLSNAVKFTPSGGHIDVQAARAGSYLEISIRDTGVGLSAEFLPFAFERFRQGDQSFSRAHGGLGLGLAIVKYLVEMHGGQVSAESAGVGQGATFRVRLPVQALVTEIHRARPDEDVSATIVAGVEANFAGRLILVVDDDFSSRELLAVLLTGCHARVVGAESAHAALECFKHEAPELIIADLGMPGEDGVSLIRRIRNLPYARGSAVPSLALSAYTRNQDRTRALEAGFNEFLSKPALPDDVVKAVARLLPRVPAQTGRRPH